MSVQPRQRGWQIDVTVDGQRFRRKVREEDEARKLEAVALDRMRRGLSPLPEEGEPERRDLRALVDLTSSLFWRGSKNERSAQLNARAALDFFGPTSKPEDITVSRLDAYVQHLRDTLGNSNATINRKLAAVKKVLRTGVQRGWIESVPHYPKLRESEAKVACLSDEEEMRLYDVAPAGMRVLLLFLLDTGARAGEAARLEWDNVDLEGRTVRLVGTKSGRPRGVPLTQRLHAVLAGMERADALVFPGWLDHRGTTQPMSDAWRRVARDAEVPYRLHDLRHTFASRLVRRGASIQAVSELLGHSDIKVTMIYAHLAPDNLRSAVSLLDAADSA